MNFYEKHILPRIVHRVCGLKPMMRQRSKIIPEASGVVLEIGIGSGLNLGYYDDKKVDHLIGIDPSPNKKALKTALKKKAISNEIYFESAESLSMADKSIDTIVCTYSLCTIPDIQATLSECRRVLKPTGQLLFIEHGLSPDPKIQKTQNRINPVWKVLGGGCHLNRDIPKFIEGQGFLISNLETIYLPGWKPATWNFWGKATRK